MSPFKSTENEGAETKAKRKRPDASSDGKRVNDDDSIHKKKKKKKKQRDKTHQEGQPVESSRISKSALKSARKKARRKAALQKQTEEVAEGIKRIAQAGKDVEPADVPTAEGTQDDLEVELFEEGPEDVQGVMHGDELVLVDKKTGRVFSSSSRGPRDEYVCIGTWDSSTKTVCPLPKKARKEPATHNDATSAIPPPPEKVEHAFEANPEDHCETSPEAHADIAPVLRAIARKLGKREEELIIYDPYYCAGGTARNLGMAGFPNVINRNEDFYEVSAITTRHTRSRVLCGHVPALAQEDP
eukprot:793047-Prorocentrum_minimum.AAC.5